MQLTTNNFQFFVVHSYTEKCLDIKEFESDLKRLNYMKRLLNRFVCNEDDITEKNVKLLLNHIICFYNVFEPDSATKILFFRFNDKKYYSFLKTFLEYLNYMPNIVEIENQKITNKKIPYNKKILQILQGI